MNREQMLDNTTELRHTSHGLLHIARAYLVNVTQSNNNSIFSTKKFVSLDSAILNISSSLSLTLSYDVICALV